MALEIRIPDASWSSQEVALEGTNITIDLYWNSRNESWHISIRDPNEEEVLSGVKLTENVSPTLRYLNKKLPKGELWCLRVNPQASKITRSNLGKDFILTYLTEEEMRSVGI